MTVSSAPVPDALPKSTFQDKTKQIDSVEATVSSQLRYARCITKGILPAFIPSGGMEVTVLACIVDCIGLLISDLLPVNL